MRIRTKVKVTGTKQVYERMAGMAKRAGDFSSVFRWAQRELEEANRHNFASQGATSGAPWMPLDNEYARWKLSEYGPLPTLIRTGDLYRDVTFLHGPPNRIGKHQATFGTNLPYAKFHQSGTWKMPARKIIFVPPLFAQRLSELVLNYLVYGKSTEVSVARLRGMLAR